MAKTWSEMNAVERRNGCLGSIFIVLVLGFAATTCGRSDTSKPEAGKDLQKLFAKVIATSATCEQPAKALGTQLVDLTKGKGTAVDAYSAANSVKSACAQAKDQIISMEAPASLGAASAKKVDEALSTCAAAMRARISGTDAMQRMLDGDRSLQNSANLQESGESVERETVLCVTQFMSVATDEGLDAEAFSKTASGNLPPK